MKKKRLVVNITRLNAYFNKPRGRLSEWNLIKSINMAPFTSGAGENFSERRKHLENSSTSKEKKSTFLNITNSGS